MDVVQLTGLIIKGEGWVQLTGLIIKGEGWGSINRFNY
jgi:hypothetical protein